MRQCEEVIIYRDDRYYAAFPSIVSRPDGELLVAFRRAPDRRRLLSAGVSHCDPNSYLVLVRSRDLGRSWSAEPELIYAHPFGGSQDPCMVQLDDASLLVSSYAWMLLPEEALKQGHQAMHTVFGWPFTFLGGYLMRSADAGATWEGPILPPQLAEQATYFPDVPIPAMNRGAMAQGRDGRLYWAVATSPKDNPGKSQLNLLVSGDRGREWAHASRIAADDEVVFNETSMVETAGGDLVAFVRTAGFADHGVAVRSHDLGKTWKPWEDMGIVGHPYHALRLPDDRVLLVYGYRHEPYGIRARVLDPECRDFSGQEMVLRDDGGGGDLGYPWSCLAADGRVLVVYYLSRENGVRHIAGTWLEVG
ncbi:MAG: sialidase family protein [Gemmatimonadota bacterium]